MSPDTDSETAVADAAPTSAPCGTFVAVVGPSGAGKDTLLAMAAEILAGDPSVVFARRIVTRDAVAELEDHDVMSRGEFADAEAAGAFCLSWHAHGLAYGLPASLDAALASGRTVVANISRRTLADAAARFPRLAIVEITAPRDVLVARVAARGRETPDEVAARIARQVELEVPAGAAAFHRIMNDGDPGEACARLVAILAPAP
ncbi:phosphonate metabolism protein/1,5-bisphosphokinase (PRPP-forming) PhnN [Aurantimonas sp. HBX-1]|uniref:phosphonate metabolism protein/1,5-bisphosphokinase (PRPP-forming) PhnN n=1 Tax=Aurantimonas sp. HBX-1 TaxID=2906072 RepID=UPI001F2DA6E9|nr:phosphonate metabolism protein/1,5-bisphosphokinase (PRPP-forming) PhnN [Aurantimonas sp. HBX-1]UIJ72105.1 phosphonate metabolism protein/1,5-bisphosphokinase (PRPP-forming) PhnN [Aurantimonas sp. HBX-1]